MRIGEGISGQVAQTARPLYIPDTELDPRFIVFDPEVRSLFVVPLIHKGEVIGTLNVDDNEQDAFSGDVGRLLTIAGAQAASAIVNAQLYHDLSERAQRLAQAHRELQESDQLKSEFVQNTSHELRTPLTFVKAYVELLLSDTLDPLTARQRSSLQIIADWTDRLVQLVDNVLTIQEVERGELDFELLDLADLVQTCVQSAQAIASQSGLSLAQEWPHDVYPVWGDRARLEQVFVNLIGNALKFSPSGGTVRVRLRNGGGTDGRPPCVQADVIDEGIGIAPDQLTKIFGRFYQVDGSSTRRFGGTGLGLAIVQETVKAHGGTITVTSEMGAGSTFSLSLPAAVDGIEPRTKPGSRRGRQETCTSVAQTGGAQDDE
jgi:signal transduction histidine kinase